MSEDNKINQKYKFRIDSFGKILFYEGNILTEDESFITICDKKLGLVRFSKSNLISQESILWSMSDGVIKNDKKNNL